MTQLKNYFIAALAVFTFALVGDDAAARGFRVGLFPNGVVNSCSNCHDNPNGGGPRNLFGSDVEELVSPGGFDPFWSPALAAEDSDSDGFTNGQEVGDIDGDGVPERTVNISLPGVAGDTPVAALGDCNLDTELNDCLLYTSDAADE